MAFRVDDIVVTEKNVLLLSGGHQFVADIEKNSDASDSGNFTRDRNPWNFYSSDGHIYHNLFDTETFDIRTQTLTGSRRHSPNNSRSHEAVFMPHDAKYLGSCQFYDTSYSVTDFTGSSLSATVNTSGGDTYSADYGFVRYDKLTSYDNPTEYYLSPTALFTPKDGVQYITEYPVNGFYTDFGDNESGGKPTLFGDSVLSKYYLDQSYSVSSYDIGDSRTRFRQMRTYYDVGCTGNSIYLVFRNNLNGVTDIVDGVHADTDAVREESSVFCPVSSIGYMSNVVTLCGSVGGEDAALYYSADPYADMFEFTSMSSVSSHLEDVLSPGDSSFILYVQRDFSEGDERGVVLTYMPRIGLDRSVYTYILEGESYDGLSIVKLPHCVAIGTGHSGILTVWSRDYLYAGGDTLVNFNPFQHACSGMPSEKSLSSTIDGSVYRDIEMFYNGVDMLGAKATVSNELSTYGARVAFMSTDYDDGDRKFSIGQFFMPAGNPLYEIETLSEEIPSTAQVLSSVPTSSFSEATGKVTWSFETRMVDVVTGVQTVTSDPFQVSANYVYDSDILFDYSSTEVSGELDVGSYAFVQFEKYGLAKCFVGDVFATSGMCKFSSTGPVNRYDSRQRLWVETDYPSGDDWRVRSKANTLNDLKAYNPVSIGETALSDGDILTLVDEYEREGWESGDYSYFMYVVDGNTSSWELTSVDYISPEIVTYDELLDSGAENGDVYWVRGAGTHDRYVYSSDAVAEWTELSAYGFFRYTVNGNLSSWEYAGDESMMRGRVSLHSQLPGVSSYYVNVPPSTPSDGDVMLVETSGNVDGFGIRPPNSFYVYDVHALKYVDVTEPGQGHCITYVHRWTPVTLVDATDDMTFDSVIVSSTTNMGEEHIRYKGVVRFDQMMFDIAGGLRENGVVVFLGDGGTYEGNTLTKGSFYRFTTSETETSVAINGWVYEGDRITFVNLADPDREYYGYDFHGMASYRGAVDSFEQLVHMSPPEPGCIYLVSDGYADYDTNFGEYSYFKYGYSGSMLDWWPYDMEATIGHRVGYYDELKFITDASEGDIALVRGDSYRTTVHDSLPNFFTMVVDGNTSLWEPASPSAHCRDVKGYAVNYTSLPYDGAEYGAVHGDIFLVENADGRAPLHVEPHSFFRFCVDGDTGTWTPTSLPESVMVSGYAESFQSIDNLSGDIGAMYYTERYDAPLVFYKLSPNGNIRSCVDATFSVISYGDDSKKPILDAIDHVVSDYGAYYVTGRPALRATFAFDAGDGRVGYENSFSDFPLRERSGVKEPLFSSTKSVSAELTPVNRYRYALDKYVEDSMGVSVRSFKSRGVNHDAAVCLVDWNNGDGRYVHDSGSVPTSGLHLQYSGICTDVYMDGTVLTSVDERTGEVYQQYSSTIYEYPHPCYGELRTAGTGIPIFDGPLGDDMTPDDIFFVNGYLVVKNYSVGVMRGKTESEWRSEPYGEDIVGAGKHPLYDSGDYPHGGYVVTNFFADTGDGSAIPFLYGSELVESSKDNPKTRPDSETFYDYSYLWHIRPKKAVEFYPESVAGRQWSPFYPSKHVDFIKYSNGYYYISLKDGDVGYDIVETETLFEEKPLRRLPEGEFVSDIRFFGGHVAVEYVNGDGRYTKWFETGKSQYKTMPVIYVEDVSIDDPPMRKMTVTTGSNQSSDVVAQYDNVEVLNSLNRFTPVVNHKSNLFSIRVEDLGFEESEYLTEHQKKVLRAYFRNSITRLVDAVKPAHTQLFDVYLD